MMQTKIIKVGDGIYNLEVDGEVRVREESFTVVSNVEEALLGHDQAPSECMEIADQIRHGFAAYMGQAN